MFQLTSPEGPGFFLRTLARTLVKLTAAVPPPVPTLGLLFLLQPLGQLEPPHLTIYSEPGSTVIWEGQAIGQTDTRGVMRLSQMPLGVYRLELAKTGFETAQLWVEVKQGFQEVNAGLKPISTSLQETGPAPEVTGAISPVAPSETGSTGPPSSTDSSIPPLREPEPGPEVKAVPASEKADAESEVAAALTAAPSEPPNRPAGPAADTQAPDSAARTSLQLPFWAPALLVVLVAGILLLIWKMRKNLPGSSLAAETGHSRDPSPEALEAFSRTLSPSSSRSEADGVNQEGGL